MQAALRLFEQADIVLSQGGSLRSSSTVTGPGEVELLLNYVDTSEIATTFSAAEAFAAVQHDTTKLPASMQAQVPGVAYAIRQQGTFGLLLC